MSESAVHNIGVLFEECIVLSSAWLRSVVVSIKWKRSLIKMLKSRRLRIYSWNTPVEIFCYLLNLLSTFVLSCLLKKWLWINLKHLYRSHKLLVYKEGDCGLAYQKLLRCALQLPLLYCLFFSREDHVLI